MHKTFQAETEMRPETHRSKTRPRQSQDVWHFVQDKTETRHSGSETETESETLQLPRPWPRRMVKTIKHHKYGSTELSICTVVGFPT